MQILMSQIQKLALHRYYSDTFSLFCSDEYFGPRSHHEGSTNESVVHHCCEGAESCFVASDS